MSAARTVPALLAERAAERGGHPLLICDDDELSYGEARARSAAVAKGLVARGLGPGSHLGLLYPNGSAFLVGWLAAARLGAVTVPLSSLSTGPELRALLRKADVDAVLAAGRYRRHDYRATLAEAVGDADPTAAAPLWSPTVPALRWVAFDDEEGVTGTGGAAAGGSDGPGRDADDASSFGALLEDGTAVAGEVLGALEAAVRPSDRLAVILTSGSTSAPKGVIHQHGPFIDHMAVLNRMRRYGPDDVLFCNAPFFWVGGIGYALLATLLSGGTLVCSNAAEPAAVLDLLERTRPTMCNGFVASVASLPADPTFSRRDLGSMTRGNLYPIMPAAARPADPELRHNLLGMTETGSVCLGSDDDGDQPESRRGSFGRPVAGLAAEVVDPETGRRCSPGQQGELYFRGPALMEGYYGRERHQSFDSDGWFHTGDQFVTDADGFYYFRGRRGDMIKTAGANVSPREVEQAILDETGLVAHVVGVDDAERGQVVAALLRIADQAPPPDAAELQDRLRHRLSSYKVPQILLALPDDEVPMMSSGKLDTRRLKEMLGARR